MKKGVAIVLGAVVGIIAGGLGVALATLGYFVASGSGGPNGLGIAVVLAGFAGLFGAAVGGASGGFLGAVAARKA